MGKGSPVDWRARGWGERPKGRGRRGLSDDPELKGAH